MLTSDFFLYTTTSRTGSQFFDFHSQTYGQCFGLGFPKRGFSIGEFGVWSNDRDLGALTELEQSNVRPFPRCILPKDILHLPSSAEQNIHQSVPISFAHCRPSKSSIDTLRPSGAMLGLAPGRSLSQMHSNTFSSSPPPPPSLSQQLFDLGTIRRKIWSLMFIDAQHAVLSLGGSAASIVRNVEDSTREQLDRLGELERMAAAGRGGADAEPETDGGAGMPQSVDEEKVIAAAAVEPGSGPLPDDGTELPTKRKRDLDSDFGTARDASPFDGAVRNKKKALEWTWSKLQGAEGWWQVLMQGIWIGGRRVLKNQYVILDVCDVPVSFVLASLPCYRALCILILNLAIFCHLIPPDAYVLNICLDLDPVHPHALVLFFCDQEVLRRHPRLQTTRRTARPLLQLPVSKSTVGPVRVHRPNARHRRCRWE